MLSTRNITSVLQHVAEILGHGQGRQGNPEAAAGRVAHLAEEEDGVGDDASLLHLVPEVVSLAGALANAGEDRHSAVIVIHAANELLEQHRLAHPRPADQAGLAAARQRSQAGR